MDSIKSGDVVALIGDFDPLSISTLLNLIDKKVILVPLTKHTKSQHEYFFEQALVDIVIEDGFISRIKHSKKNELINQLRESNRAGLVLFSTGTSGKPKAILHDLNIFLKRFETARPTLKTINFLLFDHIGGINTLLHTLFNIGTVVAPTSHTVDSVLSLCRNYSIEVLPTTPTFLRLMLMSGMIPETIPKSLKIITYGTERMDQHTLETISTLLPDVDFRQTYGMSEIGIVRVKSESRNSLFMKIGGEGIKTRVVDSVLEIKSENKMVGYLNEKSPFDEQGWYNTQDIVEEKDGLYKITGRVNDVINVGGLKFMPSDVESISLMFDGVEFAKAEGRSNPITGEHVEITVQPKNKAVIDKDELKSFLKSKLPNHMIPKRITIGTIEIGHRFKRS